MTATSFISGWLARNRRDRADARLNALAERVARSLRMPCRYDASGPQWIAIAPSMNGYRVSLSVGVVGERITLTAGSNLLLDRELVGRDPLFLLLEESTESDGTFRSLTNRGGWTFVLSRSLDTRVAREVEIADAAGDVVRRMQGTLKRLRAGGALGDGAPRDEPEHSC